jgi:outer membrane protein OmpA-like peptidoglycan-associated protein
MFVIEEGHAQFVDRTTTPPFTETVSRLALTIEGFSSTPGRRARVSTQAVIGGNSAFDLKGEIAPFGEVYADLAGELRDFKLTTVNPYADPVIAWAMKTGQLALKVHYRVEKNQLTADNEIIVRNLTVAPTRQNDEVKKKIGLPLGMIVALVTDADNGIQVNVPLSGELTQVKADPSDAIWTALKNALTNIVAAPFRAINKLVKGKGDSLDDDLQVDPVTFAAGSADVDPEMGKHLTDVAEFLRKTPMIKFALTPVAAPRDLESLKEQEVTLRIQRLQKERKLPDFSAAVAATFKEEMPDVTPPASGEAKLAALREREPAPDGLMNELLERRVAAVREALVKNEGIAAERLIPGAAKAPASEDVTEGRIEFQIEQ